MVEVQITSEDGTSVHDAGIAHSVESGGQGDGGTSNHQPGFRKPKCRITSVIGTG
jgi:hypothetical protein